MCTEALLGNPVRYGEKGGLEKGDVRQPYIKASFGLLPAVWKQLEG